MVFENRGFPRWSWFEDFLSFWGLRIVGLFWDVFDVGIDIVLIMRIGTRFVCGFGCYFDIFILPPDEGRARSLFTGH